MPPVAETSNSQPSARTATGGSGVTRTLALHEVRGLDIASTADTTAFYCYTAHGCVRLIMPTALFVDRCRCERDCNGRPLGAVKISKEIIARQDALRRELEADAAAAARERDEGFDRPEPGAYAAERAFLPPALNDGDRPARRKTNADYEAAWEYQRANLSVSQVDVCARFGLGLVNYQVWLSRHHPGELSALRDTAGLTRLGKPKCVVELPPSGVTVTTTSTPAPAAVNATSTLEQIRPLSECEGGVEGCERALRAAWECYIASGDDVTVWHVAQRLGRRASWLRRRFDSFAAEPGAPVLKPNGKL